VAFAFLALAAAWSTDANAACTNPAAVLCGKVEFVDMWPTDYARSQHYHCAVGIADRKSFSEKLNGSVAAATYANAAVLIPTLSSVCCADRQILQTRVSAMNSLRGSPTREFKRPGMTDGDYTRLLRPPRLSTPGRDESDHQQCGLHQNPLA
jgi:hypothetical protein